MALFVGDFTVIGIAGLTYADPFAPYAAIMPGQRVESVKVFACQLSTGMSHGIEIGYCHFEPDGGNFAQVTVLAADGMITRTGFFVRSNSLVLGDLVLCWGKPIHVFMNFSEVIPPLNVYWENQTYAHIEPRQPNMQLSYFAPVADLTIERQWRTVEPKKLLCA
ncbi:MAG: hypothetical protein ABI700_08325 [Chloroflexota bacterium]